MQSTILRNIMRSVLHDEVAPRTEVEGIGETAEDEAAGDSEAWTQAQHWAANRGRTNIVTERLDQLLPAGRDEGNLRRAGWLDTPETEVRDLATMEAHIRAGKGFDETRIGERR